MKKVLLKIKAVFLAILFLMASNTYAVTSHFCGSHLVDVSYFGKAKSCGMDTPAKDCDSSFQFKKKCCSETTQLIESDLESSTPKSFQNTFSRVFIISFVETYLYIHAQAPKEYEFPKDSSPPDIHQDFQILFETFLI